MPLLAYPAVREARVVKPSVAPYVVAFSFPGSAWKRTAPRLRLDTADGRSLEVIGFPGRAGRAWEPGTNGASHRCRKDDFSCEKPAASAVPLTHQ